ncbi:MAG: hypothetical protein ACI35R_13220 [Bacillus sp. (in: firmicutes)]
MKQLNIFDFLNEEKSAAWEDHFLVAELLAANNLSTNILKYAFSAKHTWGGSLTKQYYVLLEGNMVVLLSISANSFYNRVFEIIKDLSQSTLSGFHFVEVG